MKVQLLPIDTYSPSEYNPRKDLLPGDREYQAIEQSLDEFGLVEPLVGNDATGRLVGGHQRLKILKAKGEKKAWFSRVSEPDETRERALNVRLNGSQGAWDIEKLDQMLRDDTTLQELAGMDQEDLTRLTDLAARDEAYDALKGLDPPATTGAPRPGEEDDRPYGRQGGDGHEFNLSLSSEQRRTIFTAIATAKELWGVQTQPEALAQICEFFSNRAEQGDPEPDPVGD